jgi:hypothetical protein
VRDGASGQQFDQVRAIFRRPARIGMRFAGSMATAFAANLMSRASALRVLDVCFGKLRSTPPLTGSADGRHCVVGYIQRSLASTRVWFGSLYSYPPTSPPNSHTLPLVSFHVKVAARAPGTFVAAATPWVP